MRRSAKAAGAKPFRYNGLLWVLGAFLAIAVILFTERSGIRHTVLTMEEAYLDAAPQICTEQVQEQLKQTCLLLHNSQEPGSRLAAEEWKQILLDMKVGYALVDVSATDTYTFDGYETVVVSLSNLEDMGLNVIELSDWVEQGGNALFSMPLEDDHYAKMLAPKLGVVSSGYRNALVKSYYPEEAFMLGGGRSYPISDPFESSRAVTLSEKANVHVWSGDEKKTPLVWEQVYGEGKFVVVNLGNYEKTVRGFYAAAYSLLTDCMVYPVINGAAFYLDRFPAPSFGGNGAYIRRDYGLSVDAFYNNIWWPDMVKIADKYHIRYTGTLLENDGDDTSGNVEMTHDTQKFQYFGNLLLHQQGEIGYHGYNHQPLCLSYPKDKGMLPYEAWKDEEAMERAMTELLSFGENMFPNVQKSVYVPPSHILSEEGRTMISEQYPEIRTIASYYLPMEFGYEQEFEVAEDGIVEQPRITSGFVPDDYMMLTALSELNMHLVNNHCIHPDEVLSEAKDAEKGWEYQKEKLQAYMEWLYTSAPCIDPLTASQLSGRVQRFAAAAAEKTVTETHVRLKIRNLYDTAYFMVRFNEGSPETVTGGTLEHMTGNLYLLRAESETVTIKMSR